jgi:hypothetical protein
MLSIRIARMVFGSYLMVLHLGVYCAVETTKTRGFGLFVIMNLNGISKIKFLNRWPFYNRSN